MPPLKGRPLRLYLLAAKESIGCLLAQNNVEGHEQAIYYLSRVLNSVERRYTPIEKFCLNLYLACTKLRHYLFKSQAYVSNRLDGIHAKPKSLDKSTHSPLLCQSSPWSIFHRNKLRGKI